jgi:SPP1 family predicted phage head-tail adaptor
VTGGRIDAYELTREFTVVRQGLADDGQGGQTETPGAVGTVRAKVNEPSALERVEAMRSGVELTFQLHLLPDAGVRRGDELQGGGEVYRVVAAVTPSVPVYLRATCTREQAEGEGS